VETKNGSDDEVSILKKQVDDLNKQLKIAKVHECELETQLVESQKKCRRLAKLGQTWWNKVLSALASDKAYSAKYN